MHLRNVCLALIAVAMAAYCQGVATPPATPVVLDGTYQVRYATNLTQSGDSYVDIINTGGNGAPANGPGFGAGTTGNICVNVYIIDPGEELLACCSCLVTPNQTVDMAVKAGIFGNTLTGELPNSVTIKLVGSNAGAANCNNTAATVTAANILTDGYVAFGTTQHQTATAGTFATTETPFLPVGLSTAELTSLTSRCNFILGNGSGFGVCAQCKQGALGAAKH